MKSDSKKIIVVLGGSGELGRSIIKHFLSRNNSTSDLQFALVNIDFIHNDLADYNFCLPLTLDEIKSRLNSVKFNNVFNAIISVAGGWKASSFEDDDIIQSSELAWNQNIQPAFIATHLSYAFNPKLLILTGAAASLDLTPNMIAYGTAKNAVIYIGRNIISTKPRYSLNFYSSFFSFRTIILLPKILDTNSNRQSMGKNGKSLPTWTPLNAISRY